MPPRIVFSPQYDITLFGLERLHPFDSRKYGRAWAALREEFGASFRSITSRRKGRPARTSWAACIPTRIWTVRSARPLTWRVRSKFRR